MSEATAFHDADGLRSLLVESVVAQVPRLLGLQCRVPAMRACGLFDRAYWNYAVVPFPNARMQEASLTLALLFALRHPENPYADRAALRTCALSGMRAWAGIQLRSGAFNDLYPREHSYVATAFSGYAVAEAARILGGDSLDGAVRDALLRCGHWLARAKPSPVANQVCGAAAALAAMGALLGDEGFSRRARELVRGAAERQSPEGWLPEYGGPDIGYLSVAVDYLGKYYSLSNDSVAAAVAGRALDFLEHFVHPDGSAGGEYGSRSTEYLLPDGLAVFSPACGSAARILASFGAALTSGAAVSVPALDDKYLLFNAYTYLQAARRDFLLPPGAPPADGGGHVWFPEAGLAVCRGEKVRLIVNLKKGGAFYACWPGTGVSVHDSGVLFKGDRWWTGCLLGSSVPREVAASRAVCEGRMGRPIDNRPSPWKTAALNAAAALAGMTAAGAEALKWLLRGAVIGRGGTEGPAFRRTLSITGDGGVEVVDEGDLPAGARTVLVGSRLDTIYGESARYFTPSQLVTAGSEMDAGAVAVGNDRFRIHRRLSPGPGGALTVDLEGRG
jgi:hypothetical protein